MVAVLAGWYVGVLYSRQTPQTGSDFDQLWLAARALLRGQDPYAAVVAAGWPWPLYYPLPAVLVAVPFMIVPVAAARILFGSFGAGLLAYALTSRGWWGLAVFGSAAFLDALTAVQWSPILTAAALLPWLGWLLASKPTIGAALWAGFPSRAAVLGVVLITALSLAVRPGWPAEWLAATATAPHIRAPVTRIGGVLLLLALLRWRRAEARLLAALALVPHSAGIYETVPLFLVPSDRRQAVGLALLTHLAFAGSRLLPAGQSLEEGNDSRWPIMLCLIYLPVLVAILLRPNQSAEGSGGIANRSQSEGAAAATPTRETPQGSA